MVRAVSNRISSCGFLMFVNSLQHKGTSNLFDNMLKCIYKNYTFFKKPHFFLKNHYVLSTNYINILKRG